MSNLTGTTGYVYTVEHAETGDTYQATADGHGEPLESEKGHRFDASVWSIEDREPTGDSDESEE